MKKILQSCLLLIGIIFASFLTAPSIYAVDTWVYTSQVDDDFYQAYVMTEKTRWNKSHTYITTKVKQVYPNGRVKKVDWIFEFNGKIWVYYMNGYWFDASIMPSAKAVLQNCFQEMNK